MKDNFKHYEKGPWLYPILEDLLGDGIFNTDGERWHSQRKTAAHLFSANSFRTLIAPTFEKHGHLLVSELQRVQASGEVVDLHALYHRFTLDSIGEIAFGVNIGSLKDPSIPFARAFDGAQYCVDKRIFNPFWWLFPFAPNERLVKRNVAIMDKFSYDLINERRSTGEYKHKTDVLSTFMKGNDQWAESEEGRADGQALYSDKYLRDVIMNFIIAGRDTTAQALSWTTYMLTQHPEVEQRMRQEMWEVLGPDKAAPGYDDIKSMVYTSAVVKETLRLYPSVPKDGKMCMKDDVWPDGTVVKKGWLAVYLPYVSGRMTSLWGPDAEEFKPQRFVDEPAPSAYKYTVFQAGPRTCLGQNMALLEAVSVLCLVYKHHTVKAQPGQDIKPQLSLTMPMQNGFKATLHPAPKPAAVQAK